MLASILAFASRIRAWFSPRLVDQEFESELESHLDLLTEENLRRGMSHEEAVRAARIRLGGAAQLKEINRELRGLPWFDALLQDLRYAFRTLGKSPGFSAVSILTLALGIGANTAIFSVVYAVLLKPLPYPHAEQLFSVFEQQKKNESTQTGMSYLNLDDLRQQNQVFDSLAGVIVHELTLTGPREPVIVKTAVVTSDFFSVFRQKPLAGRVFLPEDAQPGAPATVVVSEGFWKGPLRGEPGIIGSSINLDKRSYQVIGIMPASFRFPAIQEGQQVWIPLPSDPMFGSWMPRRGGHWLLVVGPQTRSNGGPGASRARRHCCTVCRGISGRKHGMAHSHEAVATALRRGRPYRAAGLAWRGRPCPADCVRQSRQLVPGSRHFALPRARRARRSRSRTRSPRPAAHE